ncbi:hypothetical protein H0R92_04145 [Treponema sp. OMZ 840]|uniref:amidohydrolase family protein n=1 Tax=Treponema sp. OMZ 840 TaxID=244313 RepID=UPI003D94E5C8
MILKKLDIHAHVLQEKMFPCMADGTVYGLTCDELRLMYDKINVEKGVALPLVSPEHMSDQFTNKDAYRCCMEHPDTIGWWFCNIDPRWLTNNPQADLSLIIEYYKSLGAKGIGEFTANLPVDDPMMQNVFYHAQKCNMPVLFHVGKQGDDYGMVDDLGLPKIEATLQKFPKLKLIGHSHKWWSEISGDCTWENRGGNPVGPVVPGGRVVELMRTYPNMLADLSAGSGENAIMRDPEFGYTFLEEFQDKLFFGVDYCCISNFRKLSAFLDHAVESHRISQTCYNKICRENLLALLGE